jgi:hypothetical protein
MSVEVLWLTILKLALSFMINPTDIQEVKLRMPMSKGLIALS